MFSRLAGGLAEKIDPSIAASPAQPSFETGQERIVQGTSRSIDAPAAKTGAGQKFFSGAPKVPDLPVADKIFASVEYLKAHKLYYPLILLAGVFVLYFAYRPAFVVLAFIAIGAASRIHQRYLRGLSIGIEMIIFGMAVAGKLYGVWPAILIGVISLPLSVVYTEEDFKWLPVALCGMVLVGVLAASLPAMSIVMMGVVLTLVYDITTCAVYMYVFHARFFSTAIFIATHLAFNYFLFSRFGETVLSMLA